MSESSSSGFLPEEWQGPTMNLFFINIGFYILTWIIGGSFVLTGLKALILFGFSIDSVFNGQLWTPFTSIFVHGSIAHIGFNMIYLLIFGFKLEERNYDDTAIYLGYIATGILASFVSHLLFFDSSSISIGSSGAVFGLLGINAGIDKKENNPSYRSVIFLSIILFIFSSGPNTNVFAHLFGLIFGFIIGYGDYLDKYNHTYDNLI